MIPSRIARRSKKGGKAAPRKTPYRPWQRLGPNTLVHRTQFGLAPPVSKTENAGGEVSLHPRGLDALGLLSYLS